MKFYIEIENGLPKNHPAFEENLLSAFGKIPENWEVFERLPRPTPPLYKKFADPEVMYQKINGTWTDVYLYRDMTAEEKTDAQRIVKEKWARRRQAENFSAWVFDESICDFVPPIPRPQEPKNFFWQGATSSWVERPPYPNDGKTYRLDFTSATWVEVT